MDPKEKKNKEKMFQEGDFPFRFKQFEKIAEMMKNCCKEEGSMADCCSMMKKMMGCGVQPETTEEKKDTSKTV
jgi:hypothetical protein